MKVKDHLEHLIEPVVTGLGCELWGIDYFPQGRNPVLKIYIDSEEGIGIEDCESVSRQISSLLDVEDPLPGHYVLEVSSPGLDRKFFHAEQYEAFVGSKVKVTLRRPFEGQRKFTGRLCGVEDDDVVIRSGDEEVLLPFEEIEHANVVPEF